MQNKTEDKNQKKLLLAVLVCMVVMIVLIIILLLRTCNCGDGSETLNRDPNASIGQLETKTPEEIQAELDRIVEEGMFNISINPTPVFPDGSSEGNLRIENIPANHYLMSVKITLDDTGEVIYQSGLIEPNHHIENAKLIIPLEKGVYAATAVFTAHDAETEAQKGTAAAKINVIIEN